ncbi:MAG TPA: hypothetical protein VF786_05930, partial [Terriglobales bacterium]
MEDVSRPSLVSKIAAYTRRVVGSKTPEKSRETVVLCPGHQMPAEVQLDSEDQITGCSRLPADATCAEACAVQFHYSPLNLAPFLSEFGGKKCTGCGKLINDSDWYASRANLSPARGDRAPFDPKHPVC